MPHNPLPGYPGAKSASGVAERIISQMPPHVLYVEAFLGSGAVFRRKRPAEYSIGVDSDPAVIAAWGQEGTPGLTLPAVLARLGVGSRRRRSTIAAKSDEDRTAAAGEARASSFLLHHGDFLHLVASAPAVLQDPRVLIYADPPYLLETRTRLYYQREMHDRLGHLQLLSVLYDARCMVIINHYPCELYDDALPGWRKVPYRCMTRGGVKIDCLYVNYPPPGLLHDARWAGDGFRERERIKRKAKRWRSRFLAMPAAERQIVATALAEVDRPSLQAALGSGEAHER